MYGKTVLKKKLETSKKHQRKCSNRGQDQRNLSFFSRIQGKSNKKFKKSKKTCRKIVFRVVKFSVEEGNRLYKGVKRVNGQGFRRETGRSSVN